MSFEDWQKQNKELTGFESWQQENQQRGLAGEAGTAVVRTFLNEAKGLTGTFGPLFARMPAGLPAGPGAALLPMSTQAMEKHQQQSELARQAVEPIVSNIRSAEQKFQPTMDDTTGWVVNTLAGGGTQLAINLALGAELGWIGPSVNMFSVARQNVLDAGGSELEANLTGLSEAALESWGVSRLLKFKEAGKGSFKALINNVRKGLMKQAAGDLKNIGANALKSALVEGLEEVSQGGAEFVWELIPGGRNIPRKADDSVDWETIVSSLAEQGAGGALVGGLIPVGAAGAQSAIETAVEGRGQEPVKPVQEKVEFPKEETVTKQETPQINMYRTESGSRTGITEQEVVLKDGKYVDSVTGEPVVLDQEASRGAIEKPMKEKEGEQPVVERKPIPEIQKEVVQYEALLQKVQEGNKQAAGKLTNLIQQTQRPTYDELLERVQDGDKHALELIDAGFYQGGRPFGVAEQAVALTQERVIKQEPVVEQPLEPKQPAKPPRMSRKKALELGHELPDALEWSDAQRRDFMFETTGKRSMSNMKLGEMRTFVQALQEKMREEGLGYTPKELPVKELIDTIQQTRKTTELPRYQKLSRGKIVRLTNKINRGVYTFGTNLERLERFFEGLDEHKEGAFTKTFWKPVKQADELSTENTNIDQQEFIDMLSENEIDPVIWVGKREDIPNTNLSLTKFEKIGAYAHAQNEFGKAALIRNAEMSEQDIDAIINSITPEEMKVYDWLQQKYKEQWRPLKVIAAQSGIKPDTLKQEFRYTPLVYLDKELNEQEDFLSDLAKPFAPEVTTPEKRFLKKRTKKGGAGNIELDAAILYLHNINRVNRFMQMAPVARDLTRLLNNQELRQAINSRTHNQGIRLIKAWAKDSIRGYTSDSVSQFAKVVSIMRKNGIVYAIGYNIPSTLRQSLSLNNAVAVDPLMLKYVPVNFAKASNPITYKKLEQFVLDRSLLVKNRSYDRDLRAKYDQQTLKKKLQGKSPWSKKATRWIRWMDRHTVVVAWKSLYDVGMEKFNSETKAMEFADKWVGRTQPMANMKDLPDFFRGGTIEKLLSTFQNQINNNGNFYLYDIVGAKKTGEIGWTTVGYRTMFSYVLPAILFGMIGRARLPKDLKEVLTDLITYPIAPVVVVGRWIDRMIRGWNNSSTIAEAAPEEIGKLVSAAKTAYKHKKEEGELREGDLRRIIKRAATSIGSTTGRIPAQAIRITEGIIDLKAGTTDDWRRLIYSDWALNQGQKEEVPKYSGGY